jgi:hypothetical protein
MASILKSDKTTEQKIEEKRKALMTPSAAPAKLAEKV